MRDIWGNDLPIFILELCMEPAPCWYPSGWAQSALWATTCQHADRNPQKHLLLSLLRMCGFISWGTRSKTLHRHYISTFCNTRTVQIANVAQISYFFILRDSSLGRHVNAVARKTRNSSVLYHAQKKTLSKWKCVAMFVFGCSYTVPKVKSQEAR